LFAATLLFAGVSTAGADPAPFDLAGPSIEVTVTRDGKTLPIAEVPNLAPGDRLWIHPQLPPTQSQHYLLVAAFLRGATNPPPPNWFFRNETWNPRQAADGLSITVPPDAQQVLLFLAPETGGDFKTLVGAVRGRPGAFVRASQDLNQATLDRARLTRFLAAISAIDRSEPSKLAETAPLLARSLAIRVDDKCLEKMPDLRAPCMMQGQNALILNDGHSTSIVQALTTGPASDLAMEASYTPQLGYGYYSPYFASIFDIARIFDSFHTAQYQYIPALSTQRGRELALSLNTPPSFHDPKSVLVAALPAVEKTQLPPLHAVDPKEVYCAGRTTPVFPVEGAPLVFATTFAHDMALSLTGADGKSLDLPAKADPVRGGFVVDTSAVPVATLGDAIRGSLHGYWGFDRYEGPSFQLVNAHAQAWTLVSGEEGAVIVGREDTVHLQAGSASCIDRIMVKDPAGKELKVDWKAVKPNEVELKLPLQEAAPGPVTVLVAQYGADQPQPVALQAFVDPGHRDKFTIHAGDAVGLLHGTRLDEVASLTLHGVKFLPDPGVAAEAAGELPMMAEDALLTAALKQGDTGKAKITLNDGRVFDVPASVDAARPRVQLLAKSVQYGAADRRTNIQLSGHDLVPQDAKLTFSVRAVAPRLFARDAKFEIATDDETFSVILGRDSGSVIFEDASVAVLTFDPLKMFGGTAYGALRYRVQSAAGSSDWMPLANLVRLPELTGLKCPAGEDLACKLSGTNLFLLDSVSADPRFEKSVRVPDGFPGTALPVPRSADGRLYVRLRDDPAIVNLTSLVPEQLPPTEGETARAAAAGLAATPEAAAPAAAAPAAAAPAAHPPVDAPASTASTAPQ
jgi:hypothetical protein